MLDSCLIFERVSKQFRSPLGTNIARNGHVLSKFDAVVSIDEVRKIGEVKTQVEFVFFKPFLRVSVAFVIEADLEEVEQVASGLSSASYTPIS